MIRNIKVTNYLGESITLMLRNPEQSGFFIKDVDGLGPAKSNINTTESLTIDGSNYNSARLTSRNIVFNLGYYYGLGETVEEIRLKSYKYFPIKKPVTIEITNDFRTAAVLGYVESNEPNIFSKDSGGIISVICPSAYFYDLEVIETIFSGIQPLFEFPFENPSLTEKLIEFSNILQDTRKTVFYDGDIETGVIIEVHMSGSVNDLTLYNITGGQILALDSAEIIALTGSDLVANDTVIVTTLKSSKSVYLIRDGVSYNILNAVTVTGGWFIITTGDNVFTFTANSGEQFVQMKVSHRILYEGL